MHISKANMAIGHALANGSDKNLNQVFIEELLRKARPLLNYVEMFATISAENDAPNNTYAQDIVKQNFRDAFMFFTGTVWVALGCRFPSVHREAIMHSRRIRKSLHVVMETLCIQGSEAFLREIQDMLRKPSSWESNRRFLLLCDAVFDAINHEQEMKRASAKNIIAEAERMLRISA